VVERGAGAADHRHAGTVLGEATGGRQAHAKATADHYRCGICQS
jgi:hypothetical protein